MPVTITSTTDSQEAVLKAQGGNKLAPEKTVEEVKPAITAATEKTPEKTIEATTEIVKADSVTALDKEIEEETEAELEGLTAEEKADAEKLQEQKSKKKGGFKRRIDKLNASIAAERAEKAAIAAERDSWRQEVLKKNETQAKPVEAAKTPAIGEPKADDFKSQKEYLEALIDFRAEQKLSAREQKAKDEQLRSDFQKKNQNLGQKIQEFKKTHDDWDEAMDDVKEIKPAMTLSQMIIDSEDGAELIYELAKNKEEYKRINSLPPVQLARELGKFEAKLAKAAASETSKETEVKTTTKAPTPINPVGQKSGAGQKKPSEMSYREYAKYREEQIAKNK